MTLTLHVTETIPTIAVKQTLINDVFFSIKYRYIAIFYWKIINFIYYADKMFRVIKIMDFNWTGPRRYSTIFLLIKGAFSYIVLRRLYTSKAWFSYWAKFSDLAKRNQFLANGARATIKSFAYINISRERGFKLSVDWQTNLFLSEGWNSVTRHLQVRTASFAWSRWKMSAAAYQHQSMEDPN